MAAVDITHHFRVTIRDPDYDRWRRCLVRVTMPAHGSITRDDLARVVNRYRDNKIGPVDLGMRVHRDVKLPVTIVVETLELIDDPPVAGAREVPGDRGADQPGQVEGPGAEDPKACQASRSAS